MSEEQKILIQFKHMQGRWLLELLQGRTGSPLLQHRRQGGPVKDTSEPAPKVGLSTNELKQRLGADVVVDIHMIEEYRNIQGTTLTLLFRSGTTYDIQEEDIVFSRGEQKTIIPKKEIAEIYDKPKALRLWP
ncbi:hypothetical protein ACFL29_01505 [Patescibacteria group bacterium]